MKLSVVPFVLLFAVIVTAAESDKHEITDSLLVHSPELFNSNMLAVLYENKVAMLSMLVTIAVAYFLPRMSNPLIRRRRMASSRLSILGQSVRQQQRKEAAVAADGPEVDHASEAVARLREAEQHKKQADSFKDQGDFLNAASEFAKAGNMYAAARAQMSLAGMAVDDVTLGKYKEQRLVHKAAAFYYCQMAQSHASAGSLAQALAMNRAAIEQYELNAKCSLACLDHDSAIHAYCRAAELCTTVGDTVKAELMTRAAAEQREAHTAMRRAAA